MTKKVEQQAARYQHPSSRVQRERAENRRQAETLVQHLVHTAESPKDEFDTLRVIAQANDVPIARLTRALLNLRLAPKAINKPTVWQQMRGWFE